MGPHIARVRHDVAPSAGIRQTPPRSGVQPGGGGGQPSRQRRADAR